MQPLRILTWQTRDSYLYYLSQLPHEFHVMTKPQRPHGYTGRCQRWDWGDNVIEMPVEQARHAQFDCILFQHPSHYLEDQYLYLTAQQRQLPRIYIEHETPLTHPTDMRHPLDDRDVLLVHVTAFNQMMWDNGEQTTRMIEHGAIVPTGVQYSGARASGLVIANHFRRRGRRSGSDIYRRVCQRIPLELVGAESQDCGGIGGIAHAQLPQFAAQFRFLFSPMRCANLGLAVIEAMLIGMPVIGLATSDMPGVIQNGISGYVDTDIDKLEAHMQELIDDPHYAFALGRGAQRAARERFGIRRFTDDWNAALRLVTDRRP